MLKDRYYEHRGTGPPVHDGAAETNFPIYPKDVAAGDEAVNDDLEDGGACDDDESDHAAGDGDAGDDDMEFDNGDVVRADLEVEVVDSEDDSETDTRVAIAMATAAGSGRK